MGDLRETVNHEMQDTLTQVPSIAFVRLRVPSCALCWYFAALQVIFTDTEVFIGITSLHSYAYFNIFNAKPKRVVPVNIVYVASICLNLPHLSISVT